MILVYVFDDFIHVFVSLLLLLFGFVGLLGGDVDVDFAVEVIFSEFLVFLVG